MKWLLVAGLLCTALPAHAMRYALVVGNNTGKTPALKLEPLRHAEREAAVLREQLIRYGNFDAERTVLVTGGGKSDILAAAERLAAQRARDEAELGPLPTLFGFFFTGHGLAGQLLTVDEPLSGEDVAQIFKTMNATLAIGFFDACFSGGLDMETLRAKGAVATPGFNPLTELPGELINAAGTLWFVSSRPDEMSYEHDRLGGLFTHFFSESFTAARREGFGVPVESMWEYARRNTVATTERFGRHQTPQKIISKLEARGPIYLSFPAERSATLVFDPKIAGTFILQYEQGSFVERIAKEPDRGLTIPVYDGEVVLTQTSGPAVMAHRSAQLTIRSGDRIRIQQQGARAEANAIGYTEAPVHAKGDLGTLTLSRPTPQTTITAGAGYALSLAPDGAPTALHRATATLWAIRGAWSLSLAVGYGPLARRYDAWAYRGDELRAGAGTGYAVAIGRLRLDAELAAGPVWYRVRYDSGQSKNTTGGYLEAGARLSVPIPFEQPWLILQFRVADAAVYAEGDAARAPRQLALIPQLSIGLLLPPFGS